MVIGLSTKMWQPASIARLIGWQCAPPGVPMETMSGLHAARAACQSVSA